MPSWLYETGNGWVFLLVTVIIGASASFMAGRAIAQTWRSYWQLPLYGAPIAAAVRFFHYALFHEPLLSLWNLGVDFAVVLLSASLGYRLHRVHQMARQYHWLFQRTGPLHWRSTR